MRKEIIVWLFEKSQSIYTKFKKKEPWNITSKELAEYPKKSIGHHLFVFLKENQFELIPKVERHDAYHIVTGYGTKVEDEIALQYLCYGNGKRSMYLFGVVFIGTLLLPDFLKYYLQSYKLGKRCNTFHHFDYKKLLRHDLKDFRSVILPTSYKKLYR